MARTKRTSEEMFPLIQAFRESGRRRQEFADRHGFSVPVLDYWRRRFSEEHAGGFVEVLPEDVSHLSSDT